MRNFLECDGQELINEAKGMISSEYTESDIENLDEFGSQAVESARESIAEAEKRAGITVNKTEDSNEEGGKYDNLAKDIIAERSVQKALAKVKEFIEESERGEGNIIFIACELDSFISSIANIASNSDPDFNEDREVAVGILEQIAEYLLEDNRPHTSSKVLLEKYKANLESGIDPIEALEALKLALAKKEEREREEGMKRIKKGLREMLNDSGKEADNIPEDIYEEFYSTFAASVAPLQYDVEVKLVKLQAEKGLFEEAKESVELIPDPSRMNGTCTGNPLKIIAVNMAKAGLVKESEEIIMSMRSVKDKIGALREVISAESSDSLLEGLLKEVDESEEMDDKEKEIYRGYILDYQFKLKVKRGLIEDARELAKEMRSDIHQFYAYRDIIEMELAAGMDTTESLGAMKMVHANSDFLDDERLGSLIKMQIKAGRLEQAKEEARNIESVYIFGYTFRSIIKIELENGNLVEAKKLAEEIKDAEIAAETWCSIAEFELNNGLDPSLSYEKGYQHLKGLEKDDPQHIETLATLAIGKARIGATLILKNKQQG